MGMDAVTVASDWSDYTRKEMLSASASNSD